MRRKKYAAKMANLAYSSNTDYITDELIKLGIVFIKKFKFGNMDGYIATCEEGLSFVFRGTDSFSDWVTDFNFELIKTDIGTVHKGFYEQLDRYFDDLCNMIDDENTVIIGHSKGAAEAIIFSKMLKIRKDYDAEFFAFEPPRTSDSHKFNTNGYYTINSADIVPRVPLRVMDYRHTGELIYFSKRGKAYKGSKWIKRLIDFATDLDDTFSDHEPAKIEKLWGENWKKIEKILLKKYMQKLRTT